MSKKNKKHTLTPKEDLFSILQEATAVSSGCVCMTSSVVANKENSEVHNNNGEIHNQNDTVRVINLGEYRRRKVIDFVLNNTKSF